MIDFSNFNNLFSLTAYFNNEEKCKRAIVESRWSNGDVVCPYCGGHHCSSRQDGRFRCHCCKKNFSCLVGTIFENTKISLVKWFIAMYLISSHKKGISSCQLARDINVTQSTAWYMLQKVRKLYAQDNEVFSGNVELDEVYIGGKEKWKHMSKHTANTQGRCTKTKTPIFGMMEYSTYIAEDGCEYKITYVHAFVVSATDGKTLLPIVEKYIKKGSRITTDELSSYTPLSCMGYEHSIVHHGIKEFVREGINTNAMEGFWSHFRRMVTGCYHNVSDEHLQSYVDEVVYRWNTRKASQTERFQDMFAKSIGLIIKWDELKLCQVA